MLVGSVGEVTREVVVQVGVEVVGVVAVSPLIAVVEEISSFG